MREGKTPGQQGGSTTAGAASESKQKGGEGMMKEQLLSDVAGIGVFGPALVDPLREAREAIEGPRRRLFELAAPSGVQARINRIGEKD